LACLSQKNENLLLEIVAQSNKATHNPRDNKPFKIMDTHIESLKQIENIRKMDCFKDSKSPFNQALIITDITPTTLGEEIKDKIGFGVPLLLVMVIPDFVHSYTNGWLQGTVGCAASGIGCFILGCFNFDSYNSGLAKISEFFGKDNHTKINRGDRYLCLSLMHYLSTAIAQKISSWGTTT